MSVTDFSMSKTQALAMTALGEANHRTKPAEVLREVDLMFVTAGIEPTDVDPVQRVALAIQLQQMRETATANALRETAPVVIVDAIERIEETMTVD